MSRAFDIPEELLERFTNNYVCEDEEVLRGADIPNFHKVLLNSGVPKIVWNGEEKLKQGDYACVHEGELLKVRTVCVRRAESFSKIRFM